MQQDRGCMGYNMSGDESNLDSSSIITLEYVFIFLGEAQTEGDYESVQLFEFRP